MGKTPEQAAYHEANAAYQRSWRSNEPLRQRLHRMSVEIQKNSAVAGDYVALVTEMEHAEQETAALLDHRDDLYEKLVAARGY